MIGWHPRSLIGKDGGASHRWLVYVSRSMYAPSVKIPSPKNCLRRNTEFCTELTYKPSRPVQRSTQTTNQTTDRTTNPNDQPNDQSNDRPNDQLNDQSNNVLLMLLQSISIQYVYHLTYINTSKDIYIMLIQHLIFWFLHLSIILHHCIYLKFLYLLLQHNENSDWCGKQSGDWWRPCTGSRIQLIWIDSGVNTGVYDLCTRAILGEHKYL